MSVETFLYEVWYSAKFRFFLAQYESSQATAKSAPKSSPLLPFLFLHHPSTSLHSSTNAIARKRGGKEVSSCVFPSPPRPFTLHLSVTTRCPVEEEEEVEAAGEEEEGSGGAEETGRP